MEQVTITKEQILEALSEIIDPELRINIVDLGLIYDATFNSENSTIDVEMTLTSIGCPIGPQLVSAVETRCLKIDGVKEANVNVVFDPMWNPRIHATEDGKMELGIVD